MEKLSGKQNGKAIGCDGVFGEEEAWRRGEKRIFWTVESTGEH
jgi:hypothetical protein